MNIFWVILQMIATLILIAGSIFASALKVDQNSLMMWQIVIVGGSLFIVSILGMVTKKSC